MGDDVTVGGSHDDAVNLDVGYGAFGKHQGKCHLFGGGESDAGAAFNLQTVGVGCASHCGFSLAAGVVASDGIERV